MNAENGPKPAPTIEPIKSFNEFQAQSRARMEATLKLIVILASGMLTLSIGAVLGNSPLRVPSNLVGKLSWSWIFLFYSIAAVMIVMTGMIAATFHMGVRWRKALTEQPGKTVFVATWSWLRILNAAIGFSALLSFLIGLVLVAQVAVGVSRTTAEPRTSAVVAAAASVVLNTTESIDEGSQVRAAQNSAASTEQPLKESKNDRDAKAVLDRKLVDFNGDLAFYTLILAIVAVLQFFALFGQVIFLRLAFKEARRGADIARDAMIAGERAFVFALGVNPYFFSDAGTKQLHWRFRAMLKNSGDTPTRNTRMHSKCVVLDKPLALGFDFDYQTTEIGTALLGPNFETQGGIAPNPSEPAISPQDIADVQAGTKFMYFWGWVRYSDVFPGTPRYLSRYCWQLMPIGDAFIAEPTQEQMVKFPTVLHREGNCIDDESTVEAALDA